jgi:hypothetical protein
VGRRHLGEVARVERQPGGDVVAFANADRIPLRPIPWLFIGPGIALSLLAGGALALSARRSPIASAFPVTEALAN